MESQNNVVAEQDHPDIAFAKHEALDLAKALTICYNKERLERVLQEYRVLAIEPEIRTELYVTEHYKVMLMSRPDAILKRIADGALLQLEIKTKQSVNKNWIDSWEHNLQLIAQQLAVQEFAYQSGRGKSLVVGAMIEALIKGKREKDDRSGMWRQASPLIYVYGKRGDGMLVQDQWSPTWKKGWTKTLVSDFMPLDAYIQHELSPEITALKCITIHQAQPNGDEIADACEQWGLAAIRDHEHSLLVQADPEHKQSLLNEHFEQNTEMCFHYGKCGFYDLCWTPAVQEDPLASGIYKQREPHHNESLGDD